MEATFGGTTLGSRKGTHFSAQDLEEMGHVFCDTLLDYCDPDTSKSEACYQEIQDRLRRQILKRMQMKNVPGSLGDVDIDDYSSEYESDTSGSDSSCDDGLPVHLLAIAPKLQRKRRFKSRKDRNKQSMRKSSAPSQEEAKPTPSHGAKSVFDKQTKAARYSQTASSKRRDEHNPSVSVGTTPQATAFHSEDNTRPPKKIGQKFGTNKATFVQFNPPHKLLNNPVTLPHHPIATHRAPRKVQPFQLASSYAPLPRCVRAHSAENNSAKGPMEDLFRVFSSHLDFTCADEEFEQKCSQPSDTAMKKSVIKLSPSILSMLSEPKPYSDDINIEEIMNYKSTYKKGISHFHKKTSTGQEKNSTKLLQPKPHMSKNHPKFRRSVTRDPWSGGRTLRSDNNCPRTRFQTDPRMLHGSWQMVQDASNIGEPGQSPGNTKFLNSFDKKRYLTSSSPTNDQFSSSVKPQSSSTPLRLTNRAQIQSRDENIQLLYNHMGSRQNDYFSPMQSSGNVPVLEAEDSGKGPKKTINFLPSKPSKKLTKSKVDKIEIYEPKLALYFSNGVKTEL